MNIRDLRFNNKKIVNPIILDYKIANDLFLYALNGSYFRNNLIITDDFRYILEKNYPSELVYFKIIIVKYKLNENSIREIINSLNLVNKEIKINVNKIEKDEYENFNVSLSFYDKYNNSITDVRYVFFSNYIAKSGLRDPKWITLPILKQKVFIRLEVKELSLARNLTSLLHENSFFLDPLVDKRIHYLVNIYISLAQLKKSFDLEIRHNNYSKEIFFNDLIDCVSYSELSDKEKVLELINKTKDL